MEPLVESWVISSPPIVPSNLLESAKLSRNADPSYHDISPSSDMCDGESISSNGSDLSKAYVEPSMM